MDLSRRALGWFERWRARYVTFDADEPAERAEFARFAEETTLSFARVAVLIAAALTIVWWPTDWWLFAGAPTGVRAFVGWRLFMLTACAVSWIGLWAIERLRIPPELPVLGMLLVMVARSYYVFGTLGDLRSPWIHTAILLPTTSSVLTVRLGYRLAACFAIVTTAFIAYFAAFPGFWEYPYLRHVICYVAMTCVFCAWLGHGLYMLLRRDFLQRRELVRLATIDTLTGTANRNHFLERAEREARRARRYKRALSVLMIDVDSFKQINDTHGHHAGDEVLRAFALAAQSILRQSDVLGRLGGDEFGIVLAETALPAGQAVADRLRAAASGAGLVVDGRPVKFSVSIGCAELIAESEPFESALRRADQALLHAKRLGRDRVIGAPQHSALDTVAAEPVLAHGARAAGASDDGSMA